MAGSLRDLRPRPAAPSPPPPPRRQARGGSDAAFPEDRDPGPLEAGREPQECLGQAWGRRHRTTLWVTACAVPARKINVRGPLSSQETSSWDGGATSSPSPMSPPPALWIRGHSGGTAENRAVTRNFGFPTPLLALPVPEACSPPISLHRGGLGATWGHLKARLGQKGDKLAEALGRSGREMHLGDSCTPLAPHCLL